MIHPIWLFSILYVKTECENDLKFYCEKCDYKCKFEYLYNRHLQSGKHINGKIIRIHTKKQIKKIPITHKCEKCEFTSTHFYNFKTHILNNHSSIDERKKQFPYYCECCDYGIFSKDNFDKHLLKKRHLTKSK